MRSRPQRCEKRCWAISDPLPIVEAHSGLMPATRECLEFLVEAANDLGADEDRFCLIGGWAVYALTEVFQATKTRATVRHRGSLDVDLSLAVPDSVLRLPTACAGGWRGPATRVAVASGGAGLCPPATNTIWT